MALEIRVDRTACRGAKSCLRRAPGTFALDAEGKAVVLDPPRDSEEAIREAARTCPSFAIEVGDPRGVGDVR